MDILIAGALAGLGLAIPLGPMAILLISTTIKHGRQTGSFGAFAMASVDFTYAALVFAFGSAVIAALSDWVYPLRILGSVVLVYVAIRILIEARKSAQIDTPDLANSPASKFKTFAKFFGLTVLNPATAFYFVGITPSVATLSQGSAITSIFLFAAGVFLGSVVWQFFLVFAATLTKSFTEHSVQRRIQYVGGFLILALAIGLLLK
jgi:threonine/homoserine/homoserine lactone efflux protein